MILLYPLQAQTKILKLLVIDTGVNISYKSISSHIKEKTNNINYIDIIGHGTSVSLIALTDVCSNVELISCKFFNVGIPGKTKECFKKALEQHINIINYSAGGDTPDYEEYLILKQLEKNKTIIVTAAGNDKMKINRVTEYYVKNWSQNISNVKFHPISSYYPASYSLNNIIPVMNVYYDNKPNETSNYGDWLEQEIGTVIVPESNKLFGGTSGATAVRTNKIIKNWCKLNGLR